MGNATKTDRPFLINLVLALAITAAVLGAGWLVVRWISYDPETSILPAGSQAVVTGGAGAMIDPKTSPDLENWRLMPGILVRVGKDSGEEGYTDRERPVLVTIETGENHDRSASLRRCDLRPAK